MSVTAFQRADVAREFIDERRRAIPFAQEQLSVMARVARHYVRRAERVVDLGCGDGLLARVILNEYPEASAVLVDHSAPMLALAEESMTAYGGRYRAEQYDLSDPLADFLEAGADIVVSGYAIHHLPDTLKRNLYSEIFKLLRPGGVFINVEHVASATPRQEEMFDDALIDNLADSTGRNRADAARNYHDRPDKGDNILATVGAQLSWLREIGFENVDCHFKFLELAVFGGTKPGDCDRDIRVVEPAGTYNKA